MAKKVFLLIWACVLSVLTNPAVLTASDDFVAKMPDFGHTEVLVAAAEVPETAEAAEAPSIGLAGLGTTDYLGGNIGKAADLHSTAPTHVNYQVTSVVGSASEFIRIHQNLSYSDIYRYRKLVYGHNSANLLGNLSSLTGGQIFTLTEGGATTNYQVLNIVYYQNQANGLNNDPALMTQIANTALGYDVALMTCAGTPLEGGNATQRLVVFANAV